MRYHNEKQSYDSATRRKIGVEKMNDKFRIGQRVMIISSTKKSYLGRAGKIVAKKDDGFFGHLIYLVSIPEKVKLIWQYGSELELKK